MLWPLSGLLLYWQQDLLLDASRFIIEHEWHAEQSAPISTFRKAINELKQLAGTAGTVSTVLAAYLVLVGLSSARASSSEPAASGLVPISERNEVGLYLLANYRRNLNDLPPSTSNGTFDISPGFTVNQSQTVSPEPFSMTFLGAGLRYSPVSAFMVDLSIARLPGSIEYAKRARTISCRFCITTTTHSTQKVTNHATTYLQATANWIYPLRWGFRSILGGGLAYYKASVESETFKATWVPEIRAGIEYRPTRHLGLAFLVNYDLLSAGGDDPASPSQSNIRFQQLSFSPTAALYF